MSKPLIHVHWRPAAALIAAAFAVTVLDRTGLVNSPEPLLWTLVSVQWAAIAATVAYDRRRASWRVNDDRRPTDEPSSTCTKTSDDASASNCERARHGEA